MTEEDKLLTRRLMDLAEQSYKNGIYTNTRFLSLAEQSVFHQVEQELKYAAPMLIGGDPDAERCIVRFGSAETLGYEDDPPIAVLAVSPLQLKFSDDLTHRDFLGAILSLELERPVIGDIIVNRSGTIVFALEQVAETIEKELTSVKHTTVSVKRIPLGEYTAHPAERRFEVIHESVASKRADLILAKVLRLSRSDAQELIGRGLVFVNGRQLLKGDSELRFGDVFTARGYGKFVYDSDEYISRKGKVNITVRKYI